MNPCLIFYQAHKKKIQLVFSSLLPKGDDLVPYLSKENYDLCDLDAVDQDPVLPITKVVHDPTNQAATVIELGNGNHPGLHDQHTYRLTIKHTGDTVQALRLNSVGFPDPKEKPEADILAQLKVANTGIANMTAEVGKAATSITGSINTAANSAASQILGTATVAPGPTSTVVASPHMATSTQPGSSGLKGLQDQMAAATGQIIGSVQNAGTAFHHFGHGMADSLLGFPFLTEQVTPRTTSPDVQSYPSGGGGVSLQRTVDSAIRAVLGRPANPSDPKGFQAALTASFALNFVEGHTEWTYTPRAFAGAAEFGESLTGVQASLVAFAKNALDQSLPMIDALTSLDPTVEPDELEAKRAIVRTEWNEFVLELQTPGGPRASRADMILSGLTNPNGYLYEFGVDLGMVDSSNQITRDRVVTLDDEDNLTKYISLRDYVAAVSNSWQNYRDNYYLTDLGTSLLNLSRTLAVVSDDLTDLTDALDSVYVGQPERLTIRVALNVEGLDNPPPLPMGPGSPTPPTNGPPITVGNPVTPSPTEQSIVLQDAFDWIDRFVTVEAGQLIASSGRRGAAVIQNTASILYQVIVNIIRDVTPTPMNVMASSTGTYLSKIPVGLRHPRVRIPLRDLADALNDVLNAATIVIQDSPVSTPSSMSRRPQQAASAKAGAR
jgi:hypothetical protein